MQWFYSAFKFAVALFLYFQAINKQSSTSNTENRCIYRPICFTNPYRCGVKNKIQPYVYLQVWQGLLKHNWFLHKVFSYRQYKLPIHAGNIFR